MPDAELVFRRSKVPPIRIYRNNVALPIDQAKRLKDLEKENARLKKLLAEAQVDISIL